MRVFAAVFLPVEAVEDLSRTVEPVQRAYPDLRWTTGALWHLTLAYVGNITQPDSILLNRAVGDFAATLSPFRVRIAGAGAFPEPTAADVLWAGLDPGDALSSLSRDLIASLEHFGWILDRRSFRPHLTIARARERQDMSAAVELLSDYRGPFWSVPSLAVVWSRQHEDGEPFFELLGEHVLPTG